MPWGRANGAGTREMTSVCGEQNVHQTEQVLYTKDMGGSFKKCGCTRDILKSFSIWSPDMA